MPDVKPGLVLVAQVGAAHGVQGEFKLISFMDDPASVLEHSPLLDGQGRPVLALIKGRQHKGQLLVFADGVADRTTVEKLTHLKLYIERAGLPQPEEDEYYVTDLIGMAAFDIAGKPLGRVINVDNFGAGDLLDIKPSEGASFYVAFTRAQVPEVHMAERRIVVDLTEIA